MNPFSALVDLIIPRICHICEEKLIKGEQFICLECRSRLPKTNFQNYWQNKTAPNSDLNPLEECFAGQIPLGRGTAFLFYTQGSITAQLVHDFKYRNFPSLARWLGSLAAEEIMPTGFFADIDAILPIPLHWRKLMKRGYNQSERIAEGVAEKTGIPVLRNLIAKKGHRTQTALSAEQRARNTKGIFHIKNPEELSGKHLLIIDDICTSGATILSASNQLLKQCNNIKISILTIGFASN